MVQNGMPYQGMYPYYQSTQPTVQPMQQMPQMMTQNVPQQPVGVPGRIVHNPAEIRPNEVPMDGRKSYFPTDDEQAAQNIMTNCNNNYRQLHDEIIANQIAAKDAKIADQQAMINALNLAASQQAQNAYLVEQMKRYGTGGCCGANA